LQVIQPDGTKMVAGKID